MPFRLHHTHYNVHNAIQKTNTAGRLKILQDSKTNVIFAVIKSADSLPRFYQGAAGVPGPLCQDCGQGIAIIVHIEVCVMRFVDKLVYFFVYEISVHI